MNALSSEYRSGPLRKYLKQIEMKQKTAMTQLLDELVEAAKENENDDVVNFMQKMADFIGIKMLPIERTQLEEMYIHGREDWTLDPYHEKHAKETFEQKFES